MTNLETAIKNIFDLASKSHIKKHGSMRGVFCGDMKEVVKRGAK